MATEVRFYHLVRSSMESALPAILSKAIGTGQRVVVKTADAAAAEILADQLWSFDEQSFLPHGTKKDGHAARQPIWLTPGDDNPNGATILILTGGAATEKTADFTLCCEMLDGNDEAQVAAAREKWKVYKEAGYAVTYWKQTDTGGWEKK